MFLLDTNILSAAMSARPPPEVASWIAQQPADLLFTAAVCQAEILSGITVLPKGRRRAWRQRRHARHRRFRGLWLGADQSVGFFMTSGKRGGPKTEGTITRKSA